MFLKKFTEADDMRILFLSLILVSLTFAEKVLVLDVEGMTCRLCPIAVKKAISDVKGVEWVLTSLKNRVAVVVVKEEVRDEDILKAVQKAGNYRSKVIGERRF